MNIQSRRYDHRGVSEGIILAMLRPCWIGGDKYGALYDVVIDGERIVGRSHDPEHDACRALLAQGITGRLTFVGVDGTPRSSIDIEPRAERTIIDDDRRGLLVARYRKWPGSAAIAPVSPETASAPTTLPADTNEIDGRHSLTEIRGSSLVATRQIWGVWWSANFFVLEKSKK